MLDWLTHDGQASAAWDGYVPLLSQVQQLARTMLQQVTGPSEHTCWAEPRNDYDGHRCGLSLAC